MNPKNHSRRAFLSTLGSAVGGTMAIAATSQAVNAMPNTEETVEKVNVPAKSKGYQRTEHVDTYYQLADF